ncbi:MAG: hypothetical protein QXT45_00555 [Candidatus Bilamarchaeaceae archaeon]
MSEFELAEACVSLDSYELRFKRKPRIDLEKAAPVLEKIGEIFGRTKVIILAKVGEAAVSVYEDGRILLKNVDKKMAEKVGKLVVDAFERAGVFL